MLQSLRRISEHVLSALPGWIFLICGMALLGMAILVPAWVKSRQMRYNLDLMRAQAKAITQEHERFAQFNDALAHDDPIVLERMAFYYLRLQPEGVRPLTPDTPARPALYTRHTRLPVSNRDGIMPILAQRPEVVRTPSVDEMLEQPVPDPGVNYPPYQAINTRLVRITTGWLRTPLIAAAILAILAGLYMPGAAPPRPAPAPEGEADQDAVVIGEIDDDAPFDPVVGTAGQADDAPPAQAPVPG